MTDDADFTENRTADYRKDLFGRYSYVVKTNSKSNLLILYGDNGSGKTTVLTLLFHLLSTRRTRQHRAVIGSIPFGRFQVEFDSGLTVFAQRDQPGNGSYRYGADYQETALSTLVQIDEDGDLIESRNSMLSLVIFRHLLGNVWIWISIMSEMIAV